VLGPEKLGLLKLLDVIPSLAKYSDIGFGAYMIRNANKLVDVGGGVIRKGKAYNVSLTGSFAWLIIVSFLSLVIFSYVFNDIKYEFIVLILSASILSNGIERLMFVQLKLKQRFRDIARYSLISSLIKVLFVVSTIWYIDIYSPVVAILFSGLSLIVYMYSRDPLRFEVDFDLCELTKQIKVALPLGVGTLIYGVEIYAERYVVDALLSREVLGRYMLLMMVYFSSNILVNSILQALSVRLYKKLDDHADAKEVYKVVLDMAFIVSVISSVVSVIVYYLSVFLFGYYFDSYGIVEYDVALLSLIIVLTSSHVIVSTALTSNFYNQQKGVLFARIAGILFFGMSVWIVEFDASSVISELLVIKAVSILIFVMYVYSRFVSAMLVVCRHDIFMVLISVLTGVSVTVCAIFVGPVAGLLALSVALIYIYVKRDSFSYLMFI